MKSSESYNKEQQRMPECLYMCVCMYNMCVCVFMIAYRQLFFMALAYDYGPGARV